MSLKVKIRLFHVSFECPTGVGSDWVTKCDYETFKEVHDLKMEVKIKQRLLIYEITTEEIYYLPIVT